MNHRIARKKASTRSKAQRVSADVGKLLKELHHISASIQLEEDYEPFRAKNPRYLTFKAVGNAPLLRAKIVQLPNRGGRLTGLAQELAGVLHEVKPATVKAYWKKRNR